MLPIERRGPLPPILVASRRCVEDEYAPAPGEVCISIRSPAEPTPWLARFAATLGLAFVDDSFPGWRERNLVISPRDADRVIAFVEQHRAAPRLVIHCTVGASRSVSVAGALGRLYPGTVLTHAFHPPALTRWPPNRGVYLRVVEAGRRATFPQRWSDDERSTRP